MNNYREHLLDRLKEHENDELYRDKNERGVHPDPKKIATIGYGFNIEQPGAEDIWKEFRGQYNQGKPKDQQLPTFNEIKNENVAITEAQASDLLEHMVDRNLPGIKNLYSGFEQFPNGMKFAIEDSYYNSPEKLVGSNTNFYNHLNDYNATGDPESLKQAAMELGYYSNGNNLNGIKDRRMEAMENLIEGTELSVEDIKQTVADRLDFQRRTGKAINGNFIVI